MNVLDSKTNSEDIVKAIFKWRKQLAVFVGLVAVGSYLGSLLITPKFKSEAIIYPIAFKPFGEESTTEQLLQMLNGQDIRDSVISKFHLYKQYNIDSADVFHITKVNLAFDENIKFTKTEYESVSITTLDKSPLIASDMASSIVELVNSKMNAIQKISLIDRLNVLSHLLPKRKKELDSMEKAWSIITQTYSILDIEGQSTAATREYLHAIGSGASKSALDNISQYVKNLNAKGNEFFSLKERLWNIRGKYAEIENEYTTKTAEYNVKNQYVSYASRPFPSDKKAYPIRWLIVAMAIVSSLLVGIIGILVVEARKKLA